MAKKRARVGVAIPKEKFEAFTGWCDENGRIQQDALGKLLTWFVSQEPLVWSAILNGIPDQLREPWASALRIMAEQIEASGKPASRSAVVDEGRVRVNRP